MTDMEIRTVGVIGAGQMGVGIAQVFAQAGYDIRLHDVNAEKLADGHAFISDQIEKLVARDKRMSCHVSRMHPRSQRLDPAI